MLKLFKRRLYFLPRSFQGKYIFYYFIIILFCIALFTVIFSYMAAGSTSIIYDNYSLKVGSTPAILAKQLIFTNWAFILFGGSVTGIITMFLMHRISGPFYRFELTLKKMAEGDFTEKITLRKHDEGKDIASRINEINRLISTKISEIRIITETSGEALKKIRQEPGNNESMEILAENINKTRELIDFFRTDQFK